MFNTRVIVYRATISAVSCLVVPVFICIYLAYLLLSCALKLNDDDDDDDIHYGIEHVTVEQDTQTT